METLDTQASGQSRPDNRSFFQKPAGKFGMIGGAAAVAVSVLYYVIDETLMFETATANVPSIVALAVAIYAAVARKKEQNGYITFPQAFLTSLLAFVVAITISTIFTLLLMFVIDPGFVERSIDFQAAKMQEMVDEGRISEEQFEMQQNFTRNNKTNIMLFGSLGGIFIYGILGSVIFLISSAIIRKDPPAYDHS